MLWVSNVSSQMSSLPKWLFSRATSPDQAQRQRNSLWVFCQHCLKEEKLLKPPSMPSWLMTSQRNRFTPDCVNFHMKLLQVRRLTFFPFQYKKLEKVEAIPLTATSVSHDSIFFPPPSSQADTKDSGSLSSHCMCWFILLVGKALCSHEPQEMVPKLKIKGIGQWKIRINRASQEKRKKCWYKPPSYTTNHSKSPPVSR